MSVPKEELHRLIDALPQEKTFKAKDFLESLVHQDKNKKDSENLTLAKRLEDVIGIIEGNGDIARNTEEKFKQLLVEKRKKP